MEVKNDDFLRKMCSVRKKENYIFPELFPLFKGPGRAHMGLNGPLWANMDPKNTKTYVKNCLHKCL